MLPKLNMRDDAKVHALQTTSRRAQELKYGPLSEAVILVVAHGTFYAGHIDSFCNALPHSSRALTQSRAGERAHATLDGVQRPSTTGAARRKRKRERAERAASKEAEDKA